MLKQPIHRASLLALVLFGLLVFVTWMPEKKFSEEVAGVHWPVELEMQAELGRLALSHELVQDTLSFHAGRLNALAMGFESQWDYEFCCDDPQSVDQGGNVFRGKLTLQFPSEELRHILVSNLIKEGFLDLKSVQVHYNWTLAWADLKLPVPGGNQNLILQDVGFGLQMPGSRRNSSTHS